MIQKIGGETIVKASEFASKMLGKTMDSVGFEKLFRNPGDLVHIDKVIADNIKKGQKSNIAFIGLGKNGIEPLTYLTQIFLTARKSGKSLKDVLGEVDFIDIQRAADVGHSKVLLDEIEKRGSAYLKHLFRGLAPKEKEEIYEQFTSILKKSDSKYLGHQLEDFVDSAVNHNKYDLTFCNNVFYYVGKGKGPKYQYVCPGIPEFFITPGCFNRYNEVLKNLLSTVRTNGKLFFHNDVGGEKNSPFTKSLKQLVGKLVTYKEADLNIIDKIK